MSTGDSGGDGGRIPDLPPIRRESKWERVYAYLYLTLFILAPIAAVVASVHFGLITIDTTIRATADVGFAVEILVTAAVIVFVLWTFLQLGRVAGIGFFNRLFEGAAIVFDNFDYEEYRKRRNGNTNDDEPNE